MCFLCISEVTQISVRSIDCRDKLKKKKKQQYDGTYCDSKETRKEAIVVSNDFGDSVMCSYLLLVMAE